METYRPRVSNRTTSQNLLLPLSFGPASMSLLHILDTQLQKQRERMNRTSYELVVVHVIIGSEDSLQATKLIDSLKKLYSQNTYISLRLEDALHLPDIDWSSLKIARPTTLDQLFSHLPSHTSRADITATLLSQLLVSCAKKENCTTILYGHSTTRLAEKVLTSTASGRGFSLPWQVRDGPSPYGIDMAYPMRDLLSKEIEQFTRVAHSGFKDLVIFEGKKEISASSKNTTIDDLMAQYFQSVEENYPSIVANVVRTSSKLQAPASDVGDLRCGLCSLPIEKGTDGIFGWAGDQNTNEREKHEQSQSQGEVVSDIILCYGCSRSVNG